MLLRILLVLLCLFLTPPSIFADRSWTVSGGGGGAGTLNVDTADGTAITNTVTETNLYSATLPGGTLGSGQCATAKASAVATFDGSTAATFRLKYDTGAVAVTVTAAALTATPVSIEGWVCGDGTTSAQRAWVEIWRGTSLVGIQNAANLTIDSTADRTLLLSVQWGAATAAVSIQKLHAFLTATAGVSGINGVNCSAGQVPLGVDATGNAEGCFDVATQSELDVYVPATSTALAANGANCSSGQFAAGVNASGAAEGCTDVATQAELDTVTSGLAADAGAVNDADNPVHWKQIKGMPAGFADGTDDGAGGGSGDVTAVGDCATGDCFQAATANTVLAAPNGSSGQVTARALVDADVPNNITINLATAATALAANPTNCSAGQAPLGIDASGNVEGCFTPSGGGSGSTSANSEVNAVCFGDGTYKTCMWGNATDGPRTKAYPVDHLTLQATAGKDISLKDAGGTERLNLDGDTGVITANITGAVTGNASTATALAANPTDCSANQFATTIGANGNLTCAAITDADVPNNITVTLAGTATALAANGTNCSSGQAPLGVDANGNAEGCFTPSGGASACGLISCVAPTGLTGFNMSGATWDTATVSGVGYLKAAIGTTNNVALQAVTLPSPPYTLTIGFRTNFGRDFNGCGLVLHDSVGGAIQTMWAMQYTSGMHIKVANSTALNGGTGGDVSGTDISHDLGGLHFFRVNDNGTNRVYSYSSNGAFFETYYTTGSTTQLTPDRGGFGCSSYNATYPAAGVLYHIQLQ